MNSIWNTFCLQHTIKIVLHYFELNTSQQFIYFINRLSMIVQVSVVLNRTVVVTVNNNSSILDYVYLDDHTLNSSYL